MIVFLKDCKEISNKEYLELKNPEFIGRTGVNDEGEYWMVWQCDNVLYKTRNKI